MIDAVDRLIAERSAMDRGFPRGVVVSFGGHFLLLAAVFITPLLLPKKPLIQIMPGIAVALPRGGGGVKTTEAPAPSNQADPVKPAEIEAPKPKVVKPPQEERRSGLPELSDKRGKRPERPRESPPTRGGAVGGTGTSSLTPGVDFAPAGPGIPSGTDLSGDWYLAGVQRKVWVNWMQQIKPDITTPAIVTFTVLSNGSATDVRLAQSSGVSMVDYAAQRSVMSAAPFAPLPKEYGTDRITINAIFRTATR
jgi:TonB family protein